MTTSIPGDGLKAILSPHNDGGSLLTRHLTGQEATAAGNDSGCPRFNKITVMHLSGLTHIMLNRPERRNAIDLELAQELLTASVLAQTVTSRCILLTGAGAHFCVGGDLKSFHASTDLAAQLGAVTTYLHAAMVRLAALPAPLVVAAQGHIAGAGLGLACLGDIVVTEAGTTFRSAYGAIGLPPDAGTSWLLPRLIGIRRAQRMTLLGYVLRAEESVDWGLCTESVEAGGAGERAAQIAMRLTAGPTEAFGQTTRLLAGAAGRSLADQLHDESLTLSSVATTQDAVEGISAFLQRRQPAFTGRR
jgi:2-(1,2-epoxy-1,2-dihydrophenyl)acetyl-CoA isomerase